MFGYVACHTKLFKYEILSMKMFIASRRILLGGLDMLHAGLFQLWCLDVEDDAR